MFEQHDIEFEWAVEQLTGMGLLQSRNNGDITLSATGVDYTVELMNGLGIQKRVLIFLYHAILLKEQEDEQSY